MAIPVYVFSEDQTPVSAEQKEALKKIAGDEEIVVVVFKFPENEFSFNKWARANVTEVKPIIVIEDWGNFPDECKRGIFRIDSSLLKAITPKYGFIGYAPVAV